MGQDESSREEAARWRKVARLLAALYAHGVDVAAVDAMTTEQWAALAEHAGVRAPSAQTVALIRQVVADVPGRK